MASLTSSPLLEIRTIMEWIPAVFVVFKALVLGIGMFFAIKWHYDQGKKGKEHERRAVLRASGKVAAVFVLALLGLGLVTFLLAGMLGLPLV
jgi:hypothetical protein